MPRIQKLISEDFLANEPLAKLMQLEAGDCKVYFDTLFKHPFTIDHSICAVDESNKVIGCAVLTLNSTLPHLQKYNFNKDANADETVGSDDVSSKFRAILKETKRHVLARKPKEFHTIMRHEMSSVPPQYGGNNIATRMSIEGLQLIKEKIKELQFSYGEATNEISWRVRSKAKFQVASKLKYEDFGIELNHAVCFIFITVSLYFFFLSLFYRGLGDPYVHRSNFSQNVVAVGEASITDYYQNSVITLYIFLMLSLVCGRVCFYLDVPVFVGYLLLGLGIQNIPYFRNTLELHSYFIETIRLLCVILIVGRTTVNLNYQELKKHWFNSFFASIPPTAFVSGWLIVLTRCIFKIPIEIALCYGFVLSVTAPPVTYTMANKIMANKLGMQNGIAGIIRVATAFDNIFCIALINIVMDYCFPPAYYGWHTAFHIVGGTVLGIILCVFLWFFPTRIKMSQYASTRCAMFYLSCAGMLFYLKTIGWYGSAGYTILIMGFVCGTKWRMDSPGMKPLEQIYLDNIWNWIFEPWLFVFIGYNFRARTIDGRTVWISFVVVFSTMFFKIGTSLISTYFLKLKFKEKLFLSLVFIPKSSIQVANSLMIFNLSQKHPKSDTIPEAGKNFFHNVVIGLLVTTPLTQMLLTFLSKKLLDDKEIEKLVQLKENGKKYGSES
uniref:Sodium/hydrogen exchanger 9B1 n=1 Tax=Rhabditophanes sp. KR3021 TaxID=114890 RepID=A0AC35UD98_9BILA